MHAGTDCIEWLYRDQLQVDERWSVRTDRGFTWWADRQAQTIEVRCEEDGPPDLGNAYLISVRTEFLRNLELNDRAVSFLNASLMAFGSMAGPVYDETTGTLMLCSLTRVHGKNVDWMKRLISVSAVLQIGEARIMAAELAETLGAEEATSGHPQNGLRPVPDEFAESIATLVAPMGEEPCRWPESEFQEAVDRHMQRPPALMANAGGLGFTVEFPYGDNTSSLCRAFGDQPHPRYGNGLLMQQSFPVNAGSDEEGCRLALSLNADYLLQVQRLAGYGFGSYAYRDGMIHFNSFFPNVIYRRGLLPNLYHSCASRAEEMSARLTGVRWAESSFRPTRSALGRMLARRTKR